LWGADVDFVVRFESPQCVVLECICNNNIVYIAGIYASTNYLRHRQLWSYLIELQRFYLALWIFVGDFNVGFGVTYLMLLKTEIVVTMKCNSFKLFKAWTTHDDCRRLIMDIWYLDVVRTGMHWL
jgi:hypothetical protein